MRSAVTTPQRTEVCRNNWHSAGSLGWPFPVLEYKYFFQLKYTEAILSTSTRKLLWLKISKMVIAVLKNRRIVLFCIIFGTLSFHVDVKASAVVAHTATYAVLPLLKTLIFIKPPVMQANIIRCLYQARINCEACGRKGIRCENGRMLEVGHR